MNYRRSRQRERILEVLKGTKSHPNADWIYNALKHEILGLSLGTVYRNLNVLEKQGKIHKLPIGGTFDRFEAKIGPHYHLICEKCGTVQDFTMPDHPDINRQAQKKSSFKISRHRIDFFGLCEKCQTKTKKGESDG